jgi:hypothetical protein
MLRSLRIGNKIGAGIGVIYVPSRSIEFFIENVEKNFRGRKS